MANYTGDQTPVPHASRDIGTVQDLPLRFMRYGGASPGNIGDFAGDAQALAGSFNEINNRVNGQLDQMAAQQGATAGAAAGANGDVPLKQNGTISGDAYDAAAVRTMVAQHDIQARQAADRIYLQNQGNPAALKSQLDAYANGVMSSNMPEQVKTQFQVNFGNIAATYMDSAQAQQQRQVMDSDRASYLASLDQRQQTIDNLALNAENDPKAAASLGQQLSDLRQFAVSYGPKGAFTLDGVNYPADPTRAGISSATDIEKLMQGMNSRAKETRVFGKFMQLPTTQAQQNYAAAFEKAFASGQSPDGGANPLTLEQSQRLLGQMHQILGQKKALAAGQMSSLKSAVSGVQQQMEQGFSPGSDVISSIVTQAQATGDPAGLALGHMAQGMYDFQQMARQETPVQLQDWLNAARTHANAGAAQGQGPDPLLVSQVDMGQKLLANMQTELKRDPLSWGARVGLVPLQPLDGTPQAAQARIEAAHTVAQHYGTPLQLLTASEAQTWKSQWAQGTPDQKVSMIEQIQQQFGGDAKAAYNDLSTASPAIANVGAMFASSPAHLQTLKDFAAGDTLMASGDKQYTQWMTTSKNDIQTAQQNVFGDAYNYFPAAGAAVSATAARLYTARAAREGKTDGFESGLYNDALQEAAGAWTDKDGVQHGGIMKQRSNGLFSGSHYIVLPPNMTQAQFKNTMGALNDAALKNISVGGAAPVYADGEPMTADNLRDAWLISAGPGRYLVSTANPSSGNPVFVHGSGPGGRYEIDLSQLHGGKP